MGFFTDMAERVDHFDSLPLKMAMQRVEETKFIGEDGKEYYRLPMRHLPKVEGE